MPPSPHLLPKTSILPRKTTDGRSIKDPISFTMTWRNLTSLLYKEHIDNKIQKSVSIPLQRSVLSAKIYLSTDQHLTA